jgi:protein-tyrosine phosphatase
MIWDEASSPAVIVMLPRHYRSVPYRSFPYYPISFRDSSLRVNADDESGDGRMHNLKLVSMANERSPLEIMELEILNHDKNETNNIWYMILKRPLYLGAPEDDDDVDAFLQLIDISREKTAGKTSNARIVHCSAGIGRAGIFIALDWLLQELEEGPLDEVPDIEDPIRTVVDNLRQQHMMVQSDGEYNFLYKVMRKRWRDRWVRLHPKKAGNADLDTGIEFSIGRVTK